MKHKNHCIIRSIRYYADDEDDFPFEFKCNVSYSAQISSSQLNQPAFIWELRLCDCVADIHYTHTHTRTRQMCENQVDVNFKCSFINIFERKTMNETKEPFFHLTNTPICQCTNIQ